MNVREAKPGKKVKKDAGIPEEGIVIERFNWKEADDGTYKEPGMRDIPVRWADGTKGYVDAAILKEKEDE
jgi:hypothetical protein